MIVVTEEGCIIHRAMEFLMAVHGQSIFQCRDCEKEFIEFDDSSGG